MKKIRIILLLVFLPILLFSKENTIALKDALDRYVEINKKVNRVIALGTSLSFVTYLNSTSKVIALESIELEEQDKRTYTYVNRDKLKNLPVVAKGGAFIQLNYEAVMQLKPDVVFIITNNKSEADEISQKLKVPVVVLSYGFENIDLNLVNKSLLITGKVLEKEERANELVSYINLLRKSYKVPKTKKESYIGAIAYKGKQGLNSTQANFMPFNLAKVNNTISKVQQKGHAFVNDEFLLIHNPNTLFIDSACFDIVQEQFKKNKNYFKKLKAFKEDKVYVLLANTYFYTNIDQMLANSFFIAKTLYPNEYKDLDPVEKSDEIFTNFVGKPMYEVLKNGLTGFKKVVIENDTLVLKDIKRDF